jgi:hypothetical protein
MVSAGDCERRAEVAPSRRGLRTTCRRLQFRRTTATSARVSRLPHSHLTTYALRFSHLSNLDPVPYVSSSALNLGSGGALLPRIRATILSPW